MDMKNKKKMEENNYFTTAIRNWRGTTKKSLFTSKQ